jgi:hypothetical protein
VGRYLRIHKRGVSTQVFDAYSVNHPAVFKEWLSALCGISHLQHFQILQAPDALIWG